MNWSAFYETYLNTDPGILEICLRLACAMLVGLVIGSEREYTHRPAGMRTHILVALGACAVSVTGELLFSHYAALGATPDPARLSAQVITGVGFLGAGTILREGINVKGLTTAASVWAVACLGIAAGIGYYALVIAGMVLIFLTLTVFERLQDKMFKNHGQKEHYLLETTDIAATLTQINETAAREQGSIRDLTAEVTARGHRVTFRADFGGRHKKKHQQKFFAALAGAEETLSLHMSGEAAQAEL